MPFNQGDVVKATTRAEVYLIDAGKRRWIPDAPTLQSISSWDKVISVSEAEIDAVPLGDPVPSVLGTRVWPDGTLLGARTGAIYLIEGGVRRWIPDPETFNALGLSWERVNTISDTEMNLVPLGLQIPHTQRLSVPLFTDLKYNHFMESTANLLTGNGLLNVQTRIWTLTWFGGFKGVITVFGLDPNDQITFQVARQFGVDGTAIGQSDRTIAWQENVDTSATQRTVKITTAHTPGENVSWDNLVSKLTDLAGVVSAVYQVGGSSASSS
jgi:hypothetical protein